VEFVYLCASAFAAGAVNALAGGGTLLTFPALLAVPNVNAVMANATSTVALVPGSLAGAWGFRRELAGASHWVRLLIWPSVIGGAIGSILVVCLPEKYFARLVPWLILTATMLFMFQPVLAKTVGLGRHHESPGRFYRTMLIAFQFLVAVYGGYFGAGIGILMLAALALMGLDDINRMNAVKVFLAATINGVAVAVFALSGTVHWQFAGAMAVAAAAGGYCGAHYGRRIPKEIVRWIVIAIGFALAVHYFVQQQSS
jgi:uncharacterized membrane protein YfcA